MNNNDRVITQKKFRTSLKCPRLSSYGGELKASSEIEIIESVFERVCSLYLKNQQYNTSNLYGDCVVILNRYSKKYQLLQSQYDKLLNTVIIFLNEIFKSFNIFDMYPIYGPIILNQKCSKSIIKLKSSGVLRNRNQTIHLVLFSPYKTRLNVLNDPIVSLLSQTFRDFVKSHKTKRPKVVINIFYYKSEIELGYIKHITNKKIKSYDYLIEAYESKIYNPVIPCNYFCKFKTKCEKENYDI